MTALSAFGPATRSWFERSFNAPTTVQERGWPRIASGDNALLLAPTGSGKTLAAFLACLDRLTRLPLAAPPAVRVVYVSPLKALVHDVEKNLRAPLAGIQREAELLGETLRPVRVDVRTGDTPARERKRQLQDPADILVTTPESLFLILTSQARENLRLVETLIIDEIHVLAGSKRGVHLALSLERLAHIAERDPQRVGLSATQRPLDRIRKYLGGKRPVSLVDASERPALDLAIKMPSTEPEPGEHGIWPSIYPELLREIRSHRSTLVFTNSRLLCERLAQKLNELAGEPLVRAHHGSLSHAKRAEIEELLKAGELPALVATSSLELGIDMGAIDLVLLVESPGAVSTGLQRVGRAGHGVGEVSRGVLYPKFRGDLLECAVVARGMLAGDIEETRTPKNCLDVLAQQLVAMVAMEEWRVDDLYGVIRGASSYEDLSRDVFVAVLDMLSGRYPSDELADLVPRLNWDREHDTLSARRGAQTLALMNAGTIPDRGLYRVQLGDAGPRLGELDEEMVYETRPGDTIVLGASAWRVDDVQQDRVLVSPAPGRTGRLPFWRGERAGRPLELGRALGAFLREMVGQDAGSVEGWLREQTVVDERGRQALAAYVAEQRAAGEVPTDRVIVVERFRDELGDWRICVLTPFGRRVHAPWALALEARLGRARGFETQVLYGDDGIALQLPNSAEPPSLQALFPAAEEVEELVTEQLGHSALFAARFREAAARALLLPRHRIGGRSPLWLQRRRSQQLLGVARRHPQFPIVLETYRECLQDVFDVPALVELLRKARQREVSVVEVERERASPFARSLVFQYVAAYLYDGDAPLAERKAAALGLDRSLLRELLGQEELRDLLQPAAIEEVETELARLDPELRVRHADGLHDLLRRLGDLSAEEIDRRTAVPAARWLHELIASGRALAIELAGEERFIAVEDAARYRDALGVVVPSTLPTTFLEPSDRPLESLLKRYARSHGPFTTETVASRFALVPSQVRGLLQALEDEGSLVTGEIRPGGTGADWCEPEVLRRLRRRSLQHLRSEVAPVEPAAFARFLLAWQGVSPRTSLMDALAHLEGVPLAFSDLEAEILPARVEGFNSGMLDELGASGAVLWVGRGARGARDGRIALYRRERASLLLQADDDAVAALKGPSADLYRLIDERGACFLVELQTGMKLPTEELLPLLWDLAWSGLVTNDTFQPLRGHGRRSRSRRGHGVPSVGGRWSSLRRSLGAQHTDTARAMAHAEALLERYGVVSREGAADEPGGFSSLYPVLREMEESGRVRRGLFVDGLTGAQFALPGVVDRLRASRSGNEEVLILAASDPASPWGSLLPWPVRDESLRPRRVAGASVVLVAGEPVLYLEKGQRSLLTFQKAAQEPAALLAAVRAIGVRRGYKSLRLARVDGMEASASAMASRLVEAGFERDQTNLVLSRR